MTNTTPANTDATRVKLLAFAFPFRKKGVGKAAGKFITDEHEFHALLKKEASGNYSVSAKGMWHGGIHISEGGAGSSLDLKYGVRCIADGEVVAFRINRNYLVSQMPAQGDKPAREALFSTGFALVRHTMEFPKGTKLTFFSLYMHLKHMAGYESDKTLAKPGYWTPDFKVTQFANDKPTGRRAGAASTDQVGLRVRATYPRGTPLCILPRGAQVSIGKREGDWGQIKDTQGAQLIPPTAGGYVAPTVAIGGWMLLGKQAGHLVAEEIIPDSMLDRVVTLNEKPYQVKAGDLIGHLGRYDSLSQPTETSMVHIEVFCDDGIKAFIQKGRDWIDNHGHHPDDWKPLGLSSEPTLLRIDKNTKLYKQPFNEGTAPSLSDVIQIVALAQLAKNPDNKRMETAAVSGEKLPWWHVKSADVLGHDIAGWVRQENFAGGRVTREFPQSWIDFDASFEDPHDPTHTMFATTKAYVDYAMGANVPAPAAMDKLSPLMAKVYRAIYSRGNGSQAADDLRAATDDPWRALRVSRLIIKHESEWANPSKWKQLIQEIEKQTGPQPQHAEEQKRIEKLVWWDDAKAGISDLPGSDVFHIHPVGLVGNFRTDGELVCTHCGSDLTITPTKLKAIFPHISGSNAELFSSHVTAAFAKYKINTCNRASHFLGQCEVECAGFTEFREDLTYSDGDRLWSIYPTALKAGLQRLYPQWTPSQIETYSKNHLTRNDNELGEVLFGDSDYPGRDYRGRGLLHMTWIATYKEYKKASGIDVVADPSMVQNDPYTATYSSAWFWSTRSINAQADSNNVRRVTKIINPALKDFERRRAAAKRAFTQLNAGNNPCKSDWNATLTTENGW